MDKTLRKSNRSVPRPQSELSTLRFQQHKRDACERFQAVISQFDELFLSHEIGERKPDAAGFELICKQLNCQPSQIAFFDDTQENIDGAKKFVIRASLTKGETEVASALKSLLLL